MKKIFKLSLKFLVLSLTDVEREGRRENDRATETGEKEGGREREGMWEREGERD